MRTRARAIGLVLVGLVGPLLLVACGGGTSTTSTTPPTSPPAAPATASIGPAGGTLTSADGVVTLKVPKGALTQTVTLGIAPATKAPSGAVLAYELTPSGTVFAVPATLTVDTSALSLPKGTTEADVRLETASSGAWKGLYTTLDSTKHTASASLAHLSTYGVLALPLSSTLVMGWMAGAPIVSVYANDTSSGAHQQAMVAQPVTGEVAPASVAAPKPPACFMWSWVNALAYHDVSGLHQWHIAANAPAGPQAASGGDGFAIAGSGTDFTVTSNVQGTAGRGSFQAGIYNGWPSIYPDIVATIDNPSEASRTVTLRWKSHTAYNDTVTGTTFGGGAGIEIDYVAADGSCLGGAYPYVLLAKVNTTTTKTLSFAVPAGTAKIWIDVEKAGIIDLPLDIYRTTALVATLDEELHVQVE